MACLTALKYAKAFFHGLMVHSKAELQLILNAERLLTM